MRKRKHRLLSLFMVFSMVLALLPLSTITVLAAWDGSVEISDWYGDGTATDYYIDTPAELAGLAVVVNGSATLVDGSTWPGDNFVGKTVTLTAGIDLSGGDWTPIGGFSHQFSGTFDGAGKTITGLTIGSSSTPDSTLNTLGLFGAVGINAVIRNTSVEDVAIYSDFGSDSAWAFIGGLAGCSVGEITGCHSAGSITGGYRSYAGGLVGYLGDSSGAGSISDCYSVCAVASYHGGFATGASAAGGLVGYNERAEISGSHANGDVTCADGVIPGLHSNAGGFVGTNYLGTIENCYATGGVTAGNYSIAGGFSGYNDGPVSGCHAEGSVTGEANSMVGGFTGINIPTGSDPNILNCFATGDAASGDSTGDNALSYAGGFVGRNTGGIKDCYATGDATAGSAAANDDYSQFAVYAGGFAAYSDSYSASLSNCRASGTARAGGAAVDGVYTESKASAYAGGFAGYIGSMPVDNCHSLGGAEAGDLSLAGTDNTGGVYAGGFAGFVYGYYSFTAHGTVTNSFSKGSAAAGAGAVIGGFAGESHAEDRWSYESYTVIANSYATGGATGNLSANVGGFVGHNYYGAIENCYGVGLVTSGGSTNAGGFAGTNEAYAARDLLENAYYDSTKNPPPMTGVGQNNEDDGHSLGLGLGTAVMTGGTGSVSYTTSSGPSSASTFVDALNGGIGLFDLSSGSYFFWAADSGGINGGYPVFAGSWQDADNTASSFAGGDGSASDPYQISSGAQLAYLAKLINNSSTYDEYTVLHYVLIADINLGGNQWVPIGESDDNTFEGVFDGGGYLIYGLTIGNAGAGDTSLANPGLFGSIGSGAVIRNVGVSVSIHSYSSLAGGLAGENGGTIQNCYVWGSVESGDNVGVGGLVGYNDGAIQNCYVRGSVKCGNNALAGGLVGHNEGVIQNCYASAGVTGGTGPYVFVGGLIGADAGGTVQNAYLDGDAAQTVNGSAQSPKLGTGFEAGTMTGSVTELSSAVMRSAVFVDTLNEGISSLFGEASLYNAWYTDSSTSPVNSGYPFFNAAASSPAAANASNNTVGVTPTSITAGSSTTITAAGDRQNAAGAVIGDERYVPTAWASTEAGKSGTFTVTGSSYASSYTAPAAGSYTITATFQKQTWNGSTWNDLSGSTDTKTTTLTVTTASVPTTANAANNSVSVSPASIMTGSLVTITAAGDRQSVVEAVYGDERYVPTAWTSSEAGKSGTFTVTGSTYNSSYTPSSAGSYTITATFQKQTWNGSAWDDAADSTDTKTAALTVDPGTPSPATANASNNTVSVSPTSITVGSFASITAAGDRQSVIEAVYGDERYIPVEWTSDEAGKNGTFALSGDNYISNYTPSLAGSYTITATFRKQIWTEGGWTDETGSTDTKTAALRVAAAAVPTIANASNNTVSVNPAIITRGGSAAIIAFGDKQSAMGAVTGDERYIPTAWTSTEAGKNGTFTLSGGNYRSSYIPASTGSYTITVTFRKQAWNGDIWNDIADSTDTKTAVLAVNGSGSDGDDNDSDSGGSGGSSGNGGSGSSSAGSNTAAEAPQTGLGSVTTENGTTNASVDPAKLAKKIAESEKNSTLVFAITENSNKAAFNLTVADLKAIADNGSMLRLESPIGIYKLPATEIDFDSISKQYPNIGYKDIKVTVAFSKADGNNAILNGSKLTGQPVSITVSLTAGDKAIELDEFTKYVERDLPVPDGSKFTTGVVIEKDGTLRPVPTKTVTINGKKYAAIFSRTNSIYALASKSVSFDDMEGHWAKEAVNDLASRLIISGTGGNKFAPSQDITRAEFAAIVARALGLKAADSISFADVKAGSWYYSAVAAAYKYGIVSGYGDGTFKPDSKITRLEAMAMITRAMKVAGLDTVITDEAVAAELTKFIDGKNFSNWARQLAAAVIRGGLVVGSEGYARPEKNITRAETTVIVRRLLEKAGLI